jgi:hypothetical protein
MVQTNVQQIRFLHRALFMLMGMTLSSLLYAQGEVAIVDFKIRKPDLVDLVTLNNDDIVYCFLSPKEVQLTTVTSNYTQSSAVFQLSKELVRSEYIVSSRDRSFHTLYFFNYKLNAIQAYKIDLGMGTTQTISCGIIPKDESFLTAVVIEDKFYLLTVSKVTSTISLWESYRGAALTKTSFDVMPAKLHQSLESREEDLNEKKYSAIGIDKIDYRLENNLKSAHALNKLYVIDNTIVITLDDADWTWLCTINPVTKTYTEKKFSFRLENGEGSRDKQGNSFLYHKQLFRTTINHEMMNLSIIDTDSAHLKWSYNIFPEQPIAIKNGPLLSEGDNNKVLGKTGQYFNRVLSGKICIAVNEINEQYLLQVGSYEYKYSWNSTAVGPSLSMGMGMGMGGVGMGYPMMGGYGWGMPGYYSGYPGYYPGSSIPYIETTYFYSLMKVNTFEHLPVAPPKTMRERLNEYEDQKFSKGVPDLIKVTPLKNKAILMGYYAKNIHKYQLVEIR